MIRSFKDFLANQMALEQVMRVFEVTKRLPKAKQYSLTDQFRSSSQSFCTNISEA